MRCVKANAEHYVRCIPRNKTSDCHVLYNCTCSINLLVVGWIPDHKIAPLKHAKFREAKRDGY